MPHTVRKQFADRSGKGTAILNTTSWSQHGKKQTFTESLILGTRFVDKPIIMRDPKTPGFFATVNKEKSSYKIQADLWVGSAGRKKKIRSIRHTIGLVNEISLKTARNEAKILLGRIHNGEDPFLTEDEVLSNKTTVLQIINAYIADCEKRGLSPRTIQTYMKLRERYLKVWDSRVASDVLKTEASKLHENITKKNGPVSANQAMRLLRAAFNLANKKCDDETRFSLNPVKGVTFNPEKPY